MPRPAKTAERGKKEPEATSATPRGTKTQAVRNALKANPRKQPQQIAEMLQAEGWDVKLTYISVVKSNMRKGKRKKKAAKQALDALAQLLD